MLEAGNWWEGTFQKQALMNYSTGDVSVWCCEHSPDGCLITYAHTELPYGSSRAGQRDLQLPGKGNETLHRCNTITCSYKLCHVCVQCVGGQCSGILPLQHIGTVHWYHKCFTYTLHLHTNRMFVVSGYHAPPDINITSCVYTTQNRY